MLIPADDPYEAALFMTTLLSDEDVAAVAEAAELEASLGDGRPWLPPFAAVLRMAVAGQWEGVEAEAEALRAASAEEVAEWVNKVLRSGDE